MLVTAGDDFVCNVFDISKELSEDGTGCGEKEN